MSDQANKDLVRRGYEAFNRQDIPGTLAMFDEHIAWTEPDWTYGPVTEGPVYGRNEVLHMVFEPIGEYYDAFEVAPREYYGEGDTVIAEGSFRVRPKGVRETLEVPFTHVWRIRDGKAVSMRSYIDVAQLHQRLGQSRAA